MTGPISRSSAAVQRLRRLSRRRSERAREGVLLVDGPKLLEEALRCGAPVVEAYVEPGAPVPAGLLDRLRRADVPITEVEDGVLARALDLVTPQGVVAVVRQPSAALSEVLDAAAGLDRPVVAAVELQDPGNAGTVIRVAEASGAVGVVLSVGSVDPWGPKTVRAAAGSGLRVPVVAGVASDSLLDAAQRRGLPVVATTGAGGAAPEAVDLSGAFVLCIGNEAHGLPTELLEGADVRLAIPMAGAAESLNAGVAAAVVTFEAARQRRAVGRAEQVAGGGGLVGHDGPDGRVAAGDEASRSDGVAGGA